MNDESPRKKKRRKRYKRRKRKQKKQDSVDIRPRKATRSIDADNQKITQEKLYSLYTSTNPAINDSLWEKRQQRIAAYYSYILTTMPSFYGKYLNETLQEAVESQLRLPVENQLNLFEELAISRTLAKDALQMYAEESANPKSTREQILIAGKFLYSALEVVTNFCEKAAKVDSMQRDKYSIHTINSIVAQIVNIIHIVLDIHDQHELAVELAREIRIQLKIPVQTVKLIEANANNQLGTNLTPEAIDATVIDMDSSVPNNPENE